MLDFLNSQRMKMIRIAHRGNYKGVDHLRENNPDYIEEAIAAGYDVEVDAWLIDGKWMLGHDYPSHEVPLSFFERACVWTHAKNLIGYVSLYHNTKAHVFWHNKDDFTITSKGIKWANTHVITYDGVMVMPEYNDQVTIKLREKLIEPLGICSDNFSLFNL